jgi:hypothetical protein
MEKENIFKTLESKFKSIQAKVNSNSRSQAIRNKFTTDSAKLNALFSSSKQEKYKTGLNEHRELMLEQLRSQRDRELNQVNELKANPELNQQQLTDLSKSLKSAHFVLAKSKQTALESILHRTRFENKLSLAKKAKFSHLYTNLSIRPHSFTKKDWLFYSITKSVNIIKLKAHLSVLQVVSYADVVNSDDLCDTLLLVDHRANKILKCLKFDKYEPDQHSVKANATHLIVFNRLASMVHVYDFNLDLVHSFSPQGRYKDACVNGYEIGLYADFKFKCFDYKGARLSKKETLLRKSLFLKYDNEQILDGDEICVPRENANEALNQAIVLLDFNDKFVYVLRQLAVEECTLFVFNRSDGAIQFKFEKYLGYENPERWRWLIEGFEFGLLEHGRFKLHVYDASRPILSSDDDRFETICIKKEFYGLISLCNKNLI